MKSEYPTTNIRPGRTTDHPDPANGHDRVGKAIRILIADDHTMFRDAIRLMLEANPDYHVIAEAADGEAAVKLTFRYHPDILLLDIAMPRQNGMKVLGELAVSGLQTRVLIVTEMIDKGDILRALQLGARGVLLKTASGQMLIESIHQVMAGEYWIGHEGVTSLIDAIRDLSHQMQRSGANFGVTPRELEIIAAVAAGYSNADIAQKFSLSEQTVKHHLSNIFDKLGVYNRLELALFAVNHRLTGAGE